MTVLVTAATLLQQQCCCSCNATVLIYESTHFAGRALQYRLRNVLPADLSSRRASFVAWSRQSLILTFIGASLCLAVIFGTNSGKSQALQAQDLQACQQEKEARVGIPFKANLCSDCMQTVQLNLFNRSSCTCHAVRLTGSSHPQT